MGLERTEGTAASQLFASSSSPAPGLVPAWLPALSKALGWLQASITHQEHCCLCWRAQRQSMRSCQSPERRLPAGHLPRAEVLSSSGTQEVWGRPHMACTSWLRSFPKPRSPTWVMVSFILTGSTPELSIQLGTPCSFLPQAVHPTMFWSLATRDTLLSQVWQRTLR